MEEQKTTNPLQAYYDACNGLLKEFCEKHEFNYEDAKNGWVANEVGGTVCCADYFFDMDVIVTDLREDPYEGKLIKWYDYQLRCGHLGLTGVNYASWLKGCPVIPEEKFREMEASKDRAMKAEREFRKLLDEYR